MFWVQGSKSRPTPSPSPPVLHSIHYLRLCVCVSTHERACTASPHAPKVGKTLLLTRNSAHMPASPPGGTGMIYRALFNPPVCLLPPCWSQMQRGIFYLLSLPFLGRLLCRSPLGADQPVTEEERRGAERTPSLHDGTCRTSEPDATNWAPQLSDMERLEGSEPNEEGRNTSEILSLQAT